MTLLTILVQSDLNKMVVTIHISEYFASSDISRPNLFSFEYLFIQLKLVIWVRNFGNVKTCNADSNFGDWLGYVSNMLRHSIDLGNSMKQSYLKLIQLKITNPDYV